MKVGGVLTLNPTRLTQFTWYRALHIKYLTQPLRYAHTTRRTSRYQNPSNGPGYPLLYLAPDPTTALFEVQALLGSIYGRWMPHPVSQLYTVVPVTITPAEQQLEVFNFGNSDERDAIGTSIQELTGDWWGYQIRSVISSTHVKQNTLVAPTQQLGAALNAHLTGSVTQSNVIGFCAPSARNTRVCNLMLFPNRIAQPGVVVATTPDGEKHELLPR